MASCADIPNTKLLYIIYIYTYINREFKLEVSLEPFA